MTIDTSIEKLTHEKQCFIDEGWDDTGELEAYDMAVNIMQKYQKVQEIMVKRPKDMISSNPTLRAISEVIEDGINYEKRTFNNEER